MRCWMKTCRCCGGRYAGVGVRGTVGCSQRCFLHADKRGCGCTGAGGVQGCVWSGHAGVALAQDGVDGELVGIDGASHGRHWL